MSEEPYIAAASPASDPANIQEQVVAMNEALLLGALRQHELTEAAEELNAQLQLEVAARQSAVLKLEEKARELSTIARQLAEKARLIDLSNDAIIVRDLHDKVRLWNQGAKKLFGWASEDVIGKDLHSFLHTEFPKPIEEIIAQLQREGRFNGEVVQIARDGRRVRSLCGWVLDRDTDSIFTSYTDITERKRVEDALRESEERFRSLFDSAPMAVVVCDRDSVIQHYNLRAAELWGREPVCGDEKHCGSGGWLLPHEESPMKEVLRTGLPARNLEVFIERPDGSRLPVLVNIAALKNAQGEITGAITSFMDITERRALEEALLARAADLVQADRSKDEFLAMLAHELRNPLAPLRIAAEILRTPTAGPDEQAQAQQILGRQIENMSHMIDDLLDISRITEGKIELRRQPVALGPILAAAADASRSVCASRGQHLIVSLPAEPIQLDADATRLDQILANLLGNACKYSGDNSHITLAAELAQAGKKQPREVIIRVSDDGAGIAPELLPHVFDLFKQASRTLDRAHGGLGIGLTLVQRLVKLHGGSVEARSEGLGHGSEFIVRLPLPLSIPPLAPPVAAPQREIPCRLLIVDDSKDSANIVAMLLRQRGHETRTAYTAPDALAIAEEFQPEVILLDIGLPGMDGYEVARRLRSIPTLTGVFLVAMTGYGSAADRDLAFAAGFNRHLVKPLSPDRLWDCLRSRV